MSDYWTEKDVIENAILDLQHERDDLKAEIARRDEIIGGRMKVYIVTMYRNGDREKHSYVLGAFSTENNARECGEKEKDYRGGKYEPAIIRFYVDDQRIDDFVGDSDHDHDDRIL